jgi:hypothetical protein
MAAAVMDLVGDDHRGSPRKRMEWIEDLDLASQTPGIMTSHRIGVVSAPRPCTA